MAKKAITVKFHEVTPLNLKPLNLKQPLFYSIFTFTLVMLNFIVTLSAVGAVKDLELDNEYVGQREKYRAHMTKVILIEILLLDEECCYYSWIIWLIQI